MLILRSKATFVHYNAALQQARIRLYARCYQMYSQRYTQSLPMSFERAHRKNRRLTIIPKTGMKVE